MLIANPIYDVVFKRLIENERAGRFIIGTLKELSLPFTEIKRQYQDCITKTPVSYKSNFVENLPHDSYVVQEERITGSHQTRI